MHARLAKERHPVAGGGLAGTCAVGHGEHLQAQMSKCSVHVYRCYVWSYEMSDII